MNWRKNLWWKVDLHDALGIAMFTLSSCMSSACIPCGLSQYHVSWYMLSPSVTMACFLSLARCKLRLCSANHRAGYFSNLACDWLSIVWAYSEQKTENRPWAAAAMVSALFYRLSTRQVLSLVCVNSNNLWCPGIEELDQRHLWIFIFLPDN